LKLKSQTALENTAKPCRRWFRFGLRTMLALVTLVCVMSSPVIGALHRQQASPLNHPLILTDDPFQMDRSLLARVGAMRESKKRNLICDPDEIEKGMRYEERNFRREYQGLFEAYP
jgi:hypothetical protein